MKCIKCNNEVDESAIFCQYCGYQFKNRKKIMNLKVKVICICVVFIIIILGIGFYTGKLSFYKTLTSQITVNDYGKSINYSVNINGTELNDWKVFYNDGKNVYIILGGYLDNYLIPSSTRIETEKIYGVFWNRDNLKFPYSKSAYEKIMKYSNWVAFKNEYAEYAIGTPNVELYAASWNEKGYTPISVDKNSDGKYSLGYDVLGDMNLINSKKEITLPDSDKGRNDKLYYPYKDIKEECKGYFIAGANVSDDCCMFGIRYDGIISAAGVVFRSVGKAYDKNFGKYAIRPVICLKSDVRGKIDSSVKIK